MRKKSLSSLEDGITVEDKEHLVHYACLHKTLLTALGVFKELTKVGFRTYENVFSRIHKSCALQRNCHNINEGRNRHDQKMKTLLKLFCCEKRDLQKLFVFLE